MVFGDCNGMFKASGLDSAIIEDLEVHYLEEVHPDDNDQRCDEDRLDINAVAVY